VTKQIVSVPDIGGAEGVEIIEIAIAVGDQVEQDQDIVTLETDKATMDIPCSVGGTVSELMVSVGSKVSQGDALIAVDIENAAATGGESDSSTSAEVTPTDVADDTASTSQIPVLIPDGAEDADVIEVCVKVGDEVEEGDSLIVLETDKASMEIPTSASGTVVSIAIKQGDKTVVGGEIAVIESATGAPSKAANHAVTVEAAAPVAVVESPSTTVEPSNSSTNASSTPVTSNASVVAASQSKDVYAGPAARKFAREMGIDLTLLKGTGDRGRIIKGDIKAYVKDVMTGQQASPAVPSLSGAGIPPIPAVDFAQFGDIDVLPMSKIKKLTAANMSRNWLNIPHVTQFDDADITDLEDFRKGLKAEAEKRGVKLTPLPFLLKACAAALVAEPSFNVSLHHDGEHIVQKHYVNIGVAVDSPVGLVVPVIRDVDKKGLWELSAEFMAIIDKARNGKLTSADMQGGCFTISSLGAIGGQGFTPIVNAPEVAILGVSKAEIKPKWNGSEFEPRNMLPLSLSYDHRAVNGGDAGRFFTYLNRVIADVRRLLL
jgi:pyruvate dehydrogenase E2 component (dihydrolipoamide acetyltransferase)